tara:strand:- start:12135 stop:12290 length:156 start_codon:yes stop_codon:yes gene_type:complete
MEDPNFSKSNTFPELVKTLRSYGLPEEEIAKIIPAEYLKTESKGENIDNIS